MEKMIKGIYKIKWLLYIVVIAFMSVNIWSYFTDNVYSEFDRIVIAIASPVLTVLFFSVPLVILILFYKFVQREIGDMLCLIGLGFSGLMSIALLLTVLIQGFIMYAFLMPAAFAGCLTSIMARKSDS